MILVMSSETAKGRKQQKYLILIQILTDNELEDARRDEADTAREGKLASAILTMNSVNNIAHILTTNLGRRHNQI